MLKLPLPHPETFDLIIMHNDKDKKLPNYWIRTYEQVTLSYTPMVQWIYANVTGELSSNPTEAWAIYQIIVLICFWRFACDDNAIAALTKTIHYALSQS